MVNDGSDADGSTVTKGQGDCIQGCGFIYDETEHFVLDGNLLFIDAQEYEQRSSIVMEFGLADSVMVRGVLGYAVGYSEASGYSKVVGAIFFSGMHVAGGFRLLGVGSRIVSLGDGGQGVLMNQARELDQGAFGSKEQQEDGIPRMERNPRVDLGYFLRFPTEVQLAKDIPSGEGTGSQVMSVQIVFIIGGTMTEGCDLLSHEGFFGVLSSHVILRFGSGQRTIGVARPNSDVARDPKDQQMQQGRKEEFRLNFTIHGILIGLQSMETRVEKIMTSLNLQMDFKSRRRERREVKGDDSIKMIRALLGRDPGSLPWCRSVWQEAGDCTWSDRGGRWPRIALQGCG
ncbi:hypothetical protein NE237_020795 [Protea cynaroides]|uniref:Uncharacterized protein n=1 Tax=Protea cynaroides TaxID=273540 RepID=A0A9Q0H7X9_9MAGN|nr:hypothetical protein NE237_020795 [Protea cynaroides]